MWIKKYILTLLVALTAGFGFVVSAETLVPAPVDEEFVFNPQTNRYELRSIIAPDLTTPTALTRDEYLDYTLQKSMAAYFREKNAEAYLMKDSTGKTDYLDKLLGGYKFGLGPAEKIFGPGGVQLNPRGSVDTKIGITHTSMGNPTLSEQQRSHTTFDFDPQIQISAEAKIGEKMSFDLNYNTMSTFGFDAKQIKLEYKGDEDEIVKLLAAGDVSMTTSNSLIRGGQALFGIKTDLQFGRLTVNAVVSQQESQSRTMASKGSVQTTPFEITVDSYDENQHFFFNRYFPDTYDDAMKTLPLIQSGVSITRLEVWVTNRRSNYDEARNIVAFADLGENKYISNPIVSPIGSDPYPTNRANDLYGNLTTAWAGARNISQVSSVLEGVGMVSGRDYEKIENARKLSPSEYRFNQQLGYISLQYPLQPDEVLAVAYEYSYRNAVYQVGEFGTDNPNGSTESLYLKLVKGTSHAPDIPTWHLMMRNVYTIAPNRNLDRDRFRLDIKYQSDTTGAYLNYLTEGDIANQLLLRVENLDRLDTRQEPHPDGYFDFVEGFTVQTQVGKIIFPSVQPFGSYLRKKINNDAIADKYVYQELYDSTLTVARQTAEKNKFVLMGEYKGSGSASIELNGGNIPRGSVMVMANGTRLQENVDYSINYATGDINILNPLYENANIQTSFEDQMGFSMQRKTMMGINLNYAFTPNFNVGATLMNLSEMPTEMKTAPGQESIDNTLFGFNTNYTTQSQWLTNLVDKLPLLDLTAPSQFSIKAEYAQLIAGHYKNEYGGDYSYIDDFEAARRTIDLRSPHPWFLSSTPSLFTEAKFANNIDYGKNRALLAWYTIDGLFTRKSSLSPTHIKNDADQLSNHYVREIREEELYPNKNIRYNEASTIPVLNLAYYPQERGPYNLDAAGMNPDGTLSNPKDRWGGIFRKIESSQTDFEKDNVETIEFWLLDPFIADPNNPNAPGNASGGDLYFNLGDVSEDILKDDKKFFENGLPMDGDVSKVEETVWGRIPKQQSLVYAFDTQGDRKRQDVGLNGLSTEEERSFPAYATYLSELQTKLNPDVFQTINNDPAGDNYHYYRGSDYDRDQKSILERYKYYNGTEGNSVASEASPESYATAAKLSPDVEDINQDNTLSESEKYYQYKVHLNPTELKNMMTQYVTNKRVTKPTLKNGKSEEVTWYQFKIPVREGEKVGNVDLQSIRFVRMFMTGFDRPTVLRFGTLELVRGDWRAYTKELTDKHDGSATITVSTVNIEENGDKTPVNYIMPPGVNRITDPGQTQMVLQNEQSLALTINNLSPFDARAIYKTTNLDTRQYRRMQMFVHANLPEDQLSGLQDNNLYVFLRLGSDYKNNYYEYEVPLKLTAQGNYSGNSNSDREIVWPNMLDFPFEVLTNLKLNRNKAKRQAGATVSYTKPYSEYDPQQPNNKITVQGNPTLSEIKVIMIGVRNESGIQAASAEVWVDEMRLTEFNEDGGWAGNVNAYVAVSDLGSVNFAGRMQTAGFGSLDQGVMERNLDDSHDYSISTQVEFGKFFPEKAKLTAPVSYSYRKETVSPKYNPLDQDVLLQDALDAAGSQAERDSISNFAVDITTNRSFSINGLRTGIAGKTPMPYDPANFSFSYAWSENYIRNASTEYDLQTSHQFLVGYTYAPMFKPLTPLGIGYLPKSIALNSDINRRYYELQLRDLGSLSENMIPVSFREDFYWKRSTNVAWDLTKNLTFTFNNATNARIEAPHVQVNKKLNMDDYELWKDSVWQSIRDFGTPMDYNQQFTATYNIPFKMVPGLDFLTGNLTYQARYDWHRGASNLLEGVELGNQISNERTMGLENLGINLLSLYNKSKFLEAANKRYGALARNSKATSNRRQQQKKKDEKKNTSEDALWYRIALVPARALMMVRNIGFSYTHTQGLMVPNFRPEVGDFFGQGSTPMGSAPGWDFAFGLTGEGYLGTASDKGWLIKNEEVNITPAMLNLSQTLRITATVEPAVGFKIDLNADRTKTDRSDIYYMYEGSPKRFSGNFSMTTVGLLGGNSDKAFSEFLANRGVVAARLERQYAGVNYPDAGFLQGTGVAGQPYGGGEVNENSSDVLIPSFIAAYTGGNVHKMDLDFFPSLLRLLPNWTASYDGLIQLPFMQPYFKTFTINHGYKSNYAVGAFNSYTNWVDAGNGLGFSKNVTTDSPIPSSAYDVTAVSITEAFDPLIGANTTLMNNMSLKLAYKTSRNLNLNISSYQIVEASTTDVTAGIGYRIENFNKVLHLPQTGSANMNNDLKIAADVSFRKTQSLIRKIQEALTQPVSGDQQTTIKFTADYALSHMIVTQVYFDMQISDPLVSSTAYPLTKTSAGINVKISLGR